MYLFFDGCSIESEGRLFAVCVRVCNADLSLNILLERGVGRCVPD